MKKIKRILVALDLTSNDINILKYTSQLCQLLQPDEVIFINVQKKLEYPEHIMKYFSHPEIPRDVYYKQELRQVVETNFADHNEYNTGYIVVEGGNTTGVLAHWANIKLADLLIVGKKPAHRGAGIVTRVLNRMANCSVLIIPYGARYEMERILLPTDFSNNSYKALRWGQYIQSFDTNIILDSLNVYRFPSGYYSSLDLEDKMKLIIESDRLENYKKFIVPIDKDEQTNMEFHMKLDTIQSYALSIKDYATEHRASLITIGARGTSLEVKVLGSVAEKLINYIYSIPLLIVK